jgi:hypothetical protein
MVQRIEPMVVRPGLSGKSFGLWGDGIVQKARTKRNRRLGLIHQNWGVSSSAVCKRQEALEQQRASHWTPERYGAYTSKLPKVNHSKSVGRRIGRL